MLSYLAALLSELLHRFSEYDNDTTSAADQMVMTVFASIAEFERSLIIDRTRTGRVAAPLCQVRGVKFGPRPTYSGPHQ